MGLEVVQTEKFESIFRFTTVINMLFNMITNVRYQHHVFLADIEHSNARKFNEDDSHFNLKTVLLRRSFARKTNSLLRF